MRTLTIFASLSSFIAFWGIRRLAEYAAPICRMHAKELRLEDVTPVSHWLVDSVKIMHLISMTGLILAALTFVGCLIPSVWKRIVKWKVAPMAGIIAAGSVAVLSTYAFGIYEFMFHAANHWKTEHKGLRKAVEQMGQLDEATRRVEEAKGRFGKFNERLDKIKP